MPDPSDRQALADDLRGVILNAHHGSASVDQVVDQLLCAIDTHPPHAALLRELDNARDRSTDLKEALTDAIDAFEECTGDYAKELAAEDLARWRALLDDAQPRVITDDYKRARGALRLRDGVTPEQLVREARGGTSVITLLNARTSQRGGDWDSAQQAWGLPVSDYELIVMARDALDPALRAAHPDTGDDAASACDFRSHTSDRKCRLPAGHDEPHDLTRWEPRLTRGTGEDARG